MYNDNLINLYAIAREKIGLENIKVIIEAGANDGTDSIGLESLFKFSKVYSFECNPNTVALCREAVEGHDRIVLTEKALSDKAGIVKFFPMNKEKTVTTHLDGNQGASSLFKASGKYPIEKYVQDEVIVESMTLEDFEQPDLLWLDAQGAELMIMKGMKEKLKNVKIIQCEVAFDEQYSGQPLFPEVKAFLEENGFVFDSFFDQWEWFGDAIFLNKKYV